MEKANHLNQSIVEHFLLMQETSVNDRLIYYDQRGKKFEHTIERGAVDLALKKFDGTPKAVARSTGGLVRAIPHQLVISERTTPNGISFPEVKIQVKFRDFKKDAAGFSHLTETTLRTKILEVAQILDLFDFRIQDQQRFILDFGKGVIPIYVLKYGTDSKGKVKALFIEWSDFERCTFNYAIPALTKVQVYQIDRDLLRYAPENGLNQSDWERALANHRSQITAGFLPIPNGLAAGDLISCPTNLAPLELRRHLSMELRQVNPLALHFASRTYVENGIESLTPFSERA